MCTSYNVLGLVHYLNNVVVSTYVWHTVLQGPQQQQYTKQISILSTM